MTVKPANPLPLSSQAMADLFCTITLLIRGKNTDNNDFWAYLCVKPSMANAFNEARANGVFNLEDYGTILESGEGSEVPSEIAERMERDFGINHHYEDELLKALEINTENSTV
jgi:hypothetical protein